jgi:hypothetical protein
MSTYGTTPAGEPRTGGSSGGEADSLLFSQSTKEKWWSVPVAVAAGVLLVVIVGLIILLIVAGTSSEASTRLPPEPDGDDYSGLYDRSKDEGDIPLPTPVPVELPEDPKKRMHHDDFTGNQVDTRRAFGYGLYVFEALPNINKEAVITGLFTFSPRPPPNEYPKLTFIWRWSEIDWEFVPHTRSPQREHVRCRGVFPKAKCETYRTDGENGNWTLRPTEIKGHYTNQVVVNSMRQNLYAAKYWGYFNWITPQQVETLKTWNDLINSTDEGGGHMFSYGEEWPLPGALCYKKGPKDECLQMLPEGQSLANSVAINVFRMPYGKRIVEGRGIKAPFVPHKKGDGFDVSGFAMTNEQFVYNPWYNPYDNYHTYTIRLAKTGVEFYIDAPGRGFAVDDVVPVQKLTSAEYPGIQSIGPQMPGGEIQWTPRYGSLIGRNWSLGCSQMMMNMWVDKGWGGPPRDFKQTSTYIRRVAFKPIKPSNKEYDQPFEVDFSKFPTDMHWWSKFRQDFVVEQDDAGTKSVLNVNMVSKSPDGKPALELRLCRRQMQLVGRAFYHLIPAGTAKVYEVTSGELWAHATIPNYEYFPLPESGELKVWIVVNGRRCGYNLHNQGWSLTNGTGDAVDGKVCSFMPKESDGAYVFKLVSGALKIILAPGLPPPTFPSQGYS